MYIDFGSIQAVYDSSTSEPFLLEVVVKRWENIQDSDIYILFYIYALTNSLPFFFVYLLLNISYTK